VNDIKAIAITHKHFDLQQIGQFHIAPEERAERLAKVKAELGLEELMYISTCNRVELVFTLPHFLCPGVTTNVLKALIPSMEEEQLREVAYKAERYNGTETADHLLKVASSIDSLVVGEREIITQLRKAYEECAAMHLTGDTLRLLISQCVKTAKEVYTNTDLSKKPVSVVSLAWEEFRHYGIQSNQHILLIGAGQVIRNFAKFLHENEYRNVTVVNRSAARAEEFIGTFNYNFLLLSELNEYKNGFDALVTCTASDNAIINSELYASLLNGDTAQKLVIDLALPADIDAQVVQAFDVCYVGMNQIQEKAAANIQFREQALEDCKPIIASGLSAFEKNFQVRRIERAMNSIPETIKEIKETAMGSVFAKDLEHLDENSREVLQKIMDYMEKKYISIPMKMAREVLINEAAKN
jgi:glutamyl-tRNA reductase